MIFSHSASTPEHNEPARLILGSGSSARKQLLTQAGLSFCVHTAQVDEDILKLEGMKQGLSPSAVALSLAEAKATAVAALHEGCIIGADQMLSCEGDCYDKPAGLAEARDQLKALRGRTHTLHTAVALYMDGAVTWQHVTQSHLRMRFFSDAFLYAYLETEGEHCLHSVGAYRLEGPGLQLFEKIDGDFFSILGLPLLPLLQALREREVIFS